MKKMLLVSLTAMGILILSCVKSTTLPAYTPPVATNFTVSSLKHTADTVNVGDTVYLTASGTVSDTTKNIYTYVTVSSSASGSPVYNFGTSAAPIKLSRTIGVQDSTGAYKWTAIITLPGITTVANSKLTTTANFIYQLSFSSEQGKLTATDAGANKSVFVQ